VERALHERGREDRSKTHLPAFSPQIFKIPPGEHNARPGVLNGDVDEKYDFSIS